MAYIWRNSDELTLNRDRLTIMGHSAGGHLTEVMMATNWTIFGADLPADLVKAEIPISTISYLEPIRLTEVLNKGIKMDETEAEAESPMTNHPPNTNVPQLLIVGGAETDEFHRQSQMYIDKYSIADRPMSLHTVPNVDHFDEPNVLTD